MQTGRSDSAGIARDTGARHGRTLNRHPAQRRGWRQVARMIRLGLELARAAIDYPRQVRARSGESIAQARARWLQHACRRFLVLLNVRLDVKGDIPSRGLLVCNHLSYVDILVLGALTPCRFVAKSEVESWPVFGWFARRSGTIFVRRDRRGDVPRANAQIAATLQDNLLVVLFPEGTSSDGQTVLPFRSSLLEPARAAGARLWAAGLAYGLADGDPAQEVCYWRDMTLLPHLVNLLGKESVDAAVAFAAVPDPQDDRKALAAQLRAQVLRLKPQVQPADAGF
jgi:1-acyl-sn-glycerol-3-phosphate acyltransferase